MQDEIIYPVCSICEEAIKEGQFFINPITRERICEDCIEANLHYADNYVRYCKDD